MIGGLNALPGRPGYFTETFYERSRFVDPKNGVRIDAHVTEPFVGQRATTPLIA
ncbi:MAG TPA: hypothetical protein VMX12_10495 [Acidimicrobiia bacterium]|nr:hypothetical protein [Acidimicrobiia bacterium]